MPIKKAPGKPQQKGAVSTNSRRTAGFCL